MSDKKKVTMKRGNYHPEPIAASSPIYTQVIDEALKAAAQRWALPQALLAPSENKADTPHIVGEHDDFPDSLEMALRTMTSLWNGRPRQQRRK
jgi:hypothetical protein